MEKLEVLDRLVLGKGAHGSIDEGACVMEAVAFLAGERWSDTPACASPVLGAFLRSWNDVLPDDDRQDLKRYVPRLVGSAGTPGQEDARAWLAMDWLVRSYTPVWLRLAGLKEQAERLASLPEFRAGMSVPAVRPVIDAVHSDAAAAGDAARYAAWAAAWAAAGDAAGDAARDAARYAARAAAWDAAGDAARDAAGNAARYAAGNAARYAAWDAARDAARDALQPAVTECQAAAHDLIERMLAVTEGV